MDSYKCSTCPWYKFKSNLVQLLYMSGCQNFGLAFYALKLLSTYLQTIIGSHVISTPYSSMLMLVGLVNPTRLRVALHKKVRCTYMIHSVF